MTKLTINRLDHQGRGIAYLDNKIIFVENALPDEVVEVEITEENKKYMTAIVKNYEEVSKDRITPFCPYYEKCGGCNLQHLSYGNTLKYKYEKIKNIFERNQINIPEINIIKNDSPKSYRNKLSLRIIDGQIGFYEEKSHNLIEIKNCLIAKNSINEFLRQAKKLNIKNGHITIRSNYNDELLIAITTDEKVKFLKEEFKNLKIIGVVVNEQTIYGTNFFYERMNNCLFKVSYDAFFQVNPLITSKLFNIIEENLNESNKVLDLYSGVGTLGIVASKKAKSVYSVEIIKNAVLDNIENKKINKSSNIEVLLGSADAILKKININFDSIIVDPPRKGLDKTSLNIVLNSAAKEIIYISCDPMTLARDLKILQEKYNIRKYYLLDMFSYTYHVESFVVLEKRGNNEAF